MNWNDKTIFIGDNLHVMRGMNSDSVDLIYLDPPFNSNPSILVAPMPLLLAAKPPVLRSKILGHLTT
jgi:16S rRNA G966 N2-methylase RsmD